MSALEDRPGISLTSIEFSDGTRLDLPSFGTLVIVGPNNAGKSQALRDIVTITASNQSTTKVVQRAEVATTGTGIDVVARMRADGKVTTVSGHGEQVVIAPQNLQPIDNVETWWSVSPTILAPYFVLHADTESRLNATQPVPSIDFFSTSPSLPLQVFRKSPKLEKRIDEISRKAFAAGVFMDRYTGGAVWALRMGDQPEGGNEVTEDYVRAVEQLPLVHEQGDGVKSFLGLLIRILAGSHTVILVDEPEAFLHPPQARLLSNLLATQAVESRTQTIISTHSSDVLLSALDSDLVTVVRLVREGDINHASVLKNEALKKLWGNPLLRYSNLLNGMFSDAVVICESDADCRFYEAIFDTLPDSLVESSAGRRMDIQFSHSGGKHREHTGVEALVAVKVPVVAIVDFDALNDRAMIHKLASSFEADFSPMEKTWATLNSSLAGGAKSPSVVAVSEAIAKTLSESQETVLTPKLSELARGHLKVETNWDRAKHSGLSAVPNGNGAEAARNLIAWLEAVGIVVVPTGELESLVPIAVGHGPTWVTDVLDRGLHTGPDGDAARELVKRVVSTLRGKGA
jgi:ABC-type cobalamin/Fe3+-siderophores transport system ATPase subunit